MNGLVGNGWAMKITSFVRWFLIILWVPATWGGAAELIRPKIGLVLGGGGARGAAHGEIGQTQFLPRNVVRYGTDGDGDRRIDMVRSKADALASTANFLKGHGWQTGAGYQPGEPNFAAIQGWNAATVYQQAIAHIGARIDGE